MSDPVPTEEESTGPTPEEIAEAAANPMPTYPPEESTPDIEPAVEGETPPETEEPPAGEEEPAP